MATKYLVDEEEMEESEFWDRLEEETNWECEENFDDYLDECEEEVEIFGTSFPASKVLYEMDYTMYQCMLGDYQSSQFEDYKREVERYGYVEVNKCYFEIKEEDDEEEEEENDA